MERSNEVPEVFKAQSVLSDEEVIKKRDQVFRIEHLQLQSVYEILPECYHSLLFQNLKKTLDKKQSLVFYYDGVLTNSSPESLIYHLKNLIRLKIKFPKNLEVKIYVGVPMKKTASMSGGSMAILPILKKNSLVDKIIYPAPWYPSVAFLEEKEIDFCAQNPSPILSIRSYDLYREVKQAGRMFPINCKSKIEAFQLDRVMLNHALSEQKLVKKGFQRKRKISLQVIEQSLDMKSGFKKNRENGVQSTKITLKDPSLGDNNEDLSIYSLKTTRTTKTRKGQITQLCFQYHTEEDINTLFKGILTTYKDFQKALNVMPSPHSYQVDKIEDKIAAPLFRSSIEMQSEITSEHSSESSHNHVSNSSQNRGMIKITCEKKTPTCLRIENCVERIIGHKEQVIEDCLKNGGYNSSLDLSKRWLRRLRVRRWIEKIFCKNKEFCV